MGAKLQGQVAVVSGGLGDIGRAISLELARCGADVAICDLHRSAEAQPLLSNISALERRGLYGQVDVTNDRQVSDWLDVVHTELGLPTLVIPNAAIVTVMPILSVDAVTWRRELSVNLDGTFFLAAAAARKLVSHVSPGRIVFVGSWAADHVHLQIPTYCVAKAGLRMLVKCMAAELASRAILVNEVAPGFVDAGLAARFMETDPLERERSQRQVPTGMLIEPIDVARQVVHLCDPENRHITGATVLMDGGLSLFGSARMEGP